MTKRGAVAVLTAALILLALGANTGRFLVVDDPKKSDVILVLAGETNYRPARGLELLRTNYGAKLVIDVPAGERVYQWTATELAQRWVDGLPEAQAVSICPIYGFSTKEEAREAVRCLEQAGGHSVLIVTSDFHTRRALAAFRHEVSGWVFSVAAARDPTLFGIEWWKHREWAKTELQEWMRLIWWELVDRWL